MSTRNGFLSGDRKKLKALWLCVLPIAIPLTAGCSPVLEATRPTPIDLGHFRPGQTHDSVTEEIGTPQGATAEADGASCD
jgi:hypothetical protein